MCGIAALLGKHKPECAAAMVHTMNDAQAHRGPDDQGAIVLQVGGGIVGLGNRRLAILDLSPHGHQPMHNPDTGDVLVYNGEIYNSPDLRRELQQAGFTFRGHSDTEVLLRAYQHWGVDCLPRLRGMFAFALWDARRSRLLIARDHLGIKPLYYAAREGEWFVCASEVRALMSSGLAPPVVSQRALAGYLAYGAVQEPLTLFEGVFALARGAWKEFDSLGRSTAQGTYWQFPRPDGERQRSLEEVAEEGRALLEQSVRRHLLSDVRVGIFLSSGLDSTAVLGIARRFQSATDHLNAFTVSFSDDPVYDEAAIARITAARFGVQYHEYPVEESTALAWMRDALAAMDQPSMDGFNTYLVARAVHEQGISVALSGMGGDELFAGYNSFRRVPRLHRAMSWMASLPPSWRAALARNLALSMNSVVRSKAADIATAGPDFLAIYFHTRRLLSDQGLARLGLGSCGTGSHAELPGSGAELRRMGGGVGPGGFGGAAGVGVLSGERAAARQRRLRHGQLARDPRAAARPRPGGLGLPPARRFAAAQGRSFQAPVAHHVRRPLYPCSVGAGQARLHASHRPVVAGTAARDHGRELAFAEELRPHRSRGDRAHHPNLLTRTQEPGVVARLGDGDIGTLVRAAQVGARSGAVTEAQPGGDRREGLGHRACL